MPMQIVRVTPVRQNCAIFRKKEAVPTRQEAVVIDPGGDIDLVMQVLGDARVEAILLTHGHFDHAGGVNTLKARLAQRGQPCVPVYGPHKDDIFLLNTMAEQLAAFLVDASGFETGPVIPDRFLEEGDVLNLLGRVIRVRHVPGHTPGHIVLIDETEEVVMTGDTLFRGVVGRTDFTYGDYDFLISGIKEKIMSLPDRYKIMPGHGLPSFIHVEKQYNDYLK